MGENTRLISIKSTSFLFSLFGYPRVSLAANQMKGVPMTKSNAKYFFHTAGAMLFCSFAFSSFVAHADVIADRKANFKANAAAMKAINAALGSGDFDSVIKEATKIAKWAQVIPNHFPEGSDTGDTKARAEIWMDFEGFKSRASDNEAATLALISTAKTGDLSATITALKSLGGTCKACHTSFKE